MTRDEMLRDLRKDVKASVSGYWRKWLLSRLDAILAEPALPWVSVGERMPVEADGNAESQVLWLLPEDSLIADREFTHVIAREWDWMSVPNTTIATAWSAIPLPEGE